MPTKRLSNRSQLPGSYVVWRFYFFILLLVSFFTSLILMLKSPLGTFEYVSICYSIALTVAVYGHAFKCSLLKPLTWIMASLIYIFFCFSYFALRPFEGFIMFSSQSYIYMIVIDWLITLPALFTFVRYATLLPSSPEARDTITVNQSEG